MVYCYKVVKKINGKIYIGFTSGALDSRKKYHFWETEHYPDDNNAFHNALRKYGEESFEWKIEYTSRDYDFCLNFMEPYLIRYYNSLVPNGYNILAGGDMPPSWKGRKHTEEHNRRIREASLGKKCPWNIAFNKMRRGLVNCYNKENRFLRVTKEEFYSNNELRAISSK